MPSRRERVARIRKRGRYRFSRRCGVMRLVIQSAQDVLALAELDETYWLATSAPVDGFACDAGILRYLDADGDSRVRSADFKDVVRWVARVLTSVEAIDARSDTLDVTTLNEADPEGARLAACARRIRSNLRREGSRLSLQEIRDRARILAQGDQNGDGVVGPEVVSNEQVKRLVQDIAATEGTVPDVNGSVGVNEELLDAFLKDAREHLAWRAEMDGVLTGSPGVDPWSVAREGLPAADRLGDRVDRYFDLCDARAYARELGPIGASSAEAPPPVDTDPSRFLERAPLAMPRPDGTLAPDGSANPAFRRALEELWRSTIVPLRGSTSPDRPLAREEWEGAKDVLARVRSLRDAQKGARSAPLGVERLKEVLAGGEAERLRKLIQRDREAGKELSAVRDLEFLVLAQQGLIELVNNFATLPDLYTPGRRTLLDAGRLVLDGQVFDFNLRVRDATAHSAVGKRSGIYLMYSEVVASGNAARFYIVTPVVGKRTADIYVDKRGVFFDRTGADHDARVTLVIENPVSLGQAVVAPFKRLAALIASAAEKISSGAEKQLESTVAQATTGVQESVQKGTAQAAAQTQPASAQSPAPVAGAGKVRDVLLTGGVTVAALGSSLAFIAKTVSEMNWRHILISIGVVLLLILVPNLAIASSKLRRRDLSILFEASGWATNGKIRISRRLSRVFSPRPPAPGEGARPGQSRGGKAEA